MFYSDVCTLWYTLQSMHANTHPNPLLTQTLGLQAFAIGSEYTFVLLQCLLTLAHIAKHVCQHASKPIANANTWVASIRHWSIPLYYSDVHAPWHTSRSMRGNTHCRCVDANAGVTNVSAPWHTSQSLPWQMVPAFANAGKPTLEYTLITPMLARFCCLLEGRCISLLPSLFLLFTGLFLGLLYCSIKCLMSQSSQLLWPRSQSYLLLRPGSQSSRLFWSSSQSYFLLRLGSQSSWLL